MDSYWVVPDDPSDISHYGVKGMKWGVRKSEYRSMSRDQKKSAKAEYKARRRDEKSAEQARRRKFLADNPDVDTRKNVFIRDGKKFAKGFLLTNLATLGVANLAPGYTGLAAAIGNTYNMWNLIGMGMNQFLYTYDLDTTRMKKGELHE